MSSWDDSAWNWTHGTNLRVNTLPQGRWSGLRLAILIKKNTTKHKKAFFFFFSFSLQPSNIASSPNSSKPSSSLWISCRGNLFNQTFLKQNCGQKWEMKSSGRIGNKNVNYKSVGVVQFVEKPSKESDEKLRTTSELCHWSHWG